MKKTSIIKQFLEGLSSLKGIIYPNICIACQDTLGTGETFICFKCHMTLPKTNFHLYRNNPLEIQFRGRINYEAVTAYYKFSKKSKVQRLVHQLKYKNQRDAGIELGKYFGQDLLESPIFASADIITSVPLHPKKLRLRGYNQCDALGIGMSQSLHIPYRNDIIQRVKYTETQTRKNRIGRIQNVKQIFTVNNYDIIENKHIILIDDVITTGSTLESCASELQKHHNVKVSLAGLSTAKK